jgi:hypothetical protein
MNSTRNKIAPLGTFCAMHSWWVVVVVFSLAMLPAFLPLLLQVMEPKWDAVDWALPAFTYIADAVREGRFPLWDAYTNCGYPFHADPNNGTLNPLVMLLGEFFNSPVLGFNCLWVSYWWWGGIGMIFLSRHFGAAPVGAFVAAISYVLSGFYVGHSQHTTFIMTAAWLPWVFALADRALVRSNYAYAVLAGVALGFSSYGGYPGLILFACLALSLWLLLRFLPGGGGNDNGNTTYAKRLMRIVIVLGVVGVFLLLIWSPVLHAFFTEGAGYTDRVGKLSPQEANNGDPFSIYAAISLFFPYASFVWGPLMGADISMTDGYMGLLVLPLAAFWLKSADSREGKWWLVVFVVFMFWVSLGGQYGLRTLLYYVYPPLKFIRFSAPFRIFWILPLCLAAGLGLSHLVRNPDRWRSFLRTVLIWGLLVSCAAVLFEAVSVWRGVPVAGNVLRLFAPALLILVVTGAQLWYLIVKRDGELVKYAALVLAATIFADMTAHLYINAETVWNRSYNTNILETFHKRSSYLDGAPAARTPGMPFGNTNAQQVFKKPIVQGYMTMKSREFDTTLCQSRFAEVLSGTERFWLAPGSEAFSTRAAVLEILAGVGAGSPVPAFVERPHPSLSAVRVVPATFGFVEIKKYHPEKIEMTVAVPGETEALLMSTERYSPGWQVFIDGAAAKVQQVNLYFRGVYILPGEHSVTWLYSPALWSLLVGVSYLTIFTGLVIAAIMIYRKTE